MPGMSQVKYAIPIHAKYAAAKAQMNRDARRTGHSASPTMATAARYPHDLHRPGRRIGPPEHSEELIE